jgi:hypothetical protein
MPNILEQVSELCESGYTADLRTNRQLYSIKKIAGRNPVLSLPWACGPPMGMKVRLLRVIDSKRVTPRLSRECNR